MMPSPNLHTDQTDTGILDLDDLMVCQPVKKYMNTEPRFSELVL